ncbi:uncharacterized protein BJX67DRAFT_362391 [Aspergillus lucknowensis]|uniref:Uncharacterized protein n=1 Tax=Aspergillus lucknowensis TaxID=176173 RepID=A0ABR4LH41_9EURO
MDVFDLSLAPPVDLPKEGTVEQEAGKPIDIPFDTQGASYALVDEKAPQIVEAENQELDCLMSKFTRGFDPGSFRDVIQAALPKLARNPFPGTYDHLLLLMFMAFEELQPVQSDMEIWLRAFYNRTGFKTPTETNLTDETFFAAELEMLRKLVEPIRDGCKKSVFWMNTRRVDPSHTCGQLEASIAVIEGFKNRICEALNSSCDTSKTIHSALPVSVERTAMLSMRQLRMDACKATLYWDNFNGSELELTSFFNFYRAHVSKHEPDRARAAGWLPPKSPQTPRQSAPEAGEGDLASWISYGVENEVADLLLKTALWLSVARGLAAVHLFCDVIQFFVPHSPSKDIDDCYLHFLEYLTRHRSCTGGIQFEPTPLIPEDNDTFPVRNIDYFEDVWRTSYGLSAGLYENTSFFVKHNVPNFQLAKVPPRRRPGHGAMQMAVQVPARPVLSPISSTPDETHSENGPTDDCDFFSLSPEKEPAPSRNNTF